jgi:hypothetical protein
VGAKVSVSGERTLMISPIPGATAISLSIIGCGSALVDFVVFLFTALL